MSNSETSESRFAWIGRSITLKLVLIGFLSLLLLIPAGMVLSTIKDRQRTLIEAKHSITSGWGGSQSIAGPWLEIPYLVNGVERIAYVLPDQLDIQGKIDTQTRRRGIYEAVLYGTTLNIKGSFPAVQLAAMDIPSECVQWSDARIVMAIPDMKGVRDQLTLEWGADRRKVVLEPGMTSRLPFESGVSARLPLAGNQGGAFQLTLPLNGSENLSFYPFGKVTTVQLNSAWPSPGFRDAFLPIERHMDSKGFEAKWKVLHLNRNYPQQWSLMRYPRSGYSDDDRQSVPDVRGSQFGVDLIVSADQYQQTTRCVKYAALFIVLTFGTMLWLEFSRRQSIHALQYLLTGLALLLFYSMLLALAEHIGFGKAYAAAATAITILIGWYAQLLFEDRKASFTVGAIIGGLYAYLYVLLQIADYALLVGNIGLFVTLAIIMSKSRLLLNSATSVKG